MKTGCLSESNVIRTVDHYGGLAKWLYWELFILIHCLLCYMGYVVNSLVG